MPQTRHIASEQPLTVPHNSEHRFNIPDNHHLLITAASNIFAWDSTGIHSIFKSSKGGIVASKEAQDGSGVLAVADKHVVVLHDTKREQEKSWGLEAEEDAVRHLEYTADGRSLFLSTYLTTDIQRYSTERARLLSPTQIHASPPVALAISPNGNLMITAADCPPVVYLKNIQHNSAPILIESRASSSAVSVAAFHPERPNIFLLAFRDGTIAAFDATRVGRQQSCSFSNQQHINAGEIGHLSKLHRRMSEASRVASITDAAFLPGYKSRAVTVGHDGKCRLIDFADGGSILRTWHAKAPVTSVSILSLKTPSGAGSRSGGRAAHVMGGPTSTNNLIAIGRADGQVHIYDSVGLLLCQKDVCESGNRIINVEWVKGPSPRPISASGAATELEQSVAASVSNTGHQIPTTKGKAKASSSARREPLFDHIGLPADLRKPKQGEKRVTVGTPRRFTVHPDEADEDTVRHTPLPSNSKPAALPKADYLDLFSPVKAVETRPDVATNKCVASPPRTRPRISSQTFVKSPEATPGASRTAVAKSISLALFPSTGSASPTERLAIDGTRPVSRTNQSSAEHKRAGPSKNTARKRWRNSGSITARPPAINNSAKVLADLRKMGATQAGSMLSSYAQVKPRQGSPVTRKEITSRRYLHRATTHIETSMESLRAHKAYEEAHVKHNWPTDSNQDDSLDGDIWLTSDSEGRADTMRSRNRRHQPARRPPARQTTRLGVDTNGTMSTLDQLSANAAAATVSKEYRQRVDGSTKEDEMFTADSHFSPSGTFSPSSKDVRGLFPRSSSLSPRKRRSPKNVAHLSSRKRDQTLREVAPNAVTGRQVKSPWARMKAEKSVGSPIKQCVRERQQKPVQVYEDENQNAGSQYATGAETHCSICSPTRARVNGLESELARLKAEMVVLKTVLRRNGVPLPTSLRQR